MLLENIEHCTKLSDYIMKNRIQIDEALHLVNQIFGAVDYFVSRDQLYGSLDAEHIYMTAYFEQENIRNIKFPVLAVAVAGKNIQSEV